MTKKRLPFVAGDTKREPIEKRAHYVAALDLGVGVMVSFTDPVRRVFGELGRGLGSRLLTRARFIDRLKSKIATGKDAHGEEVFKI